MALGYIRPQGNAGSFQDRYFVIQTGEPVLKKDSMWICSALPGKFLAAQENEPEVPELGDIWLYTAVNQAEEGLEITLRLDGIQTKKQVVQVYQYTTAGWVMRAWKLFQSGKWVTPTCYFYRDGKQTIPWTGMNGGYSITSGINNGYVSATSSAALPLDAFESIQVTWKRSTWWYRGWTKIILNGVGQVQNGNGTSTESFDVTTRNDTATITIQAAGHLSENDPNNHGSGRSSATLLEVCGVYKFV